MAMPDLFWFEATETDFERIGGAHRMRQEILPDDVLRIGTAVEEHQPWHVPDRL